MNNCFICVIVITAAFLVSCTSKQSPQPPERWPYPRIWHVDPDSPEKPIRVEISGEVKNPGSYTFSAKPKLSEVVTRAGSFTDFAVITDIEIIHKNGTTEKFNFKILKEFPDKDIILRDGDRIVVSEMI